MNIKKFIHQDGEGNPLAIVSVEQLWGNNYAIKYSKPELRVQANIWQKLFAQAKLAANVFGAKTLDCRLRKEYDVEVFQKILLELSFEKLSERVEYQSDVQALPDDTDSPLEWKIVKELSWDKKMVADFLNEIIVGDPGTNPNENSEDFVQDWFHHEEFTSGPECISIGFHEDQACALVVAQINAESGWSRLSYMGMIPQMRGKGLGQWVHRRGFRMIKEQGGKLYHGGTHANNIAMKKLFQKHHCETFCEMEEWTCTFEREESR